MKIYRDYFIRKEANPLKESPDHSRRYFFWPFSRKKTKSVVRSGALQPEIVRKSIQEIGVGKQIEIMRIGYDGELDDMPISVEIIDIANDHFTGKIINLERQMIESATRKLIYAKKGGGTLDFFFKDGDIKEISVSKDQELLEQERNIVGLKEILAALDTGDPVIVAYFDDKQKGTINTEGVITHKDESNETFTLQIEKINRIELEKKISKTFDIKQDLVIDIEMV